MTDSQELPLDCVSKQMLADAERRGRESAVRRARNLDDMQIIDLAHKREESSLDGGASFTFYVSEIRDLICDALRVAGAGKPDEIDAASPEDAPAVAAARALLTTPPQPQDAARDREDAGYYLASFKRPRLGAPVVWWMPDNAGYTTDLQQAGIYTDLKPSYHDSEYTVPVPVSFVSGLRIRHEIDPGDSENVAFWSAEKLRAAIDAARGAGGGGHG